MQAGVLHSLLVVILLGTPLANAGAETITWDGEIDSNWFNPANWDPDAYPADDANRIVSLGTPTASADVRADSGGVITVTSGALATFGANLYVADASTGTLNIMAGGAVTGTNGYIGHSAGSNGTGMVDGGGSTWTTYGDLYVAREGSGTLTITGGAAVRNTYGHIGYSADSNGTVTVDGAGSTWTNSQYLHVGRAGSGRLTVAGGASLSNQGASIGYEPGSTGDVTVRDPCSMWTTYGDLSVGREGVGSLSIAAGGYAHNGWSACVGRDPGSTGTVAVEGEGSTWSSAGGLYVGGSDTAAGGTGGVSVCDGALLEVGEALKVWPDGTLDVAGGKVRIGGGAEPNAGQVRIGPDGTLDLRGGQVTCGSFDNTAGGTLDFTGGTLTVDGGAFDPGDPNVTLNGPGNPTLTLTGGATVAIGREVRVGWTDGNEGTLNILDGARIS
ncbi:MAG: hypothetical protein WBF17_24200, partial [Phycisphaerae bacterium]